MFLDLLAFVRLKRVCNWRALYRQKPPTEIKGLQVVEIRDYLLQTSTDIQRHDAFFVTRAKDNFRFIRISSSLSARFAGQNWKDSLSIGVLMNTRGLMELVVLNISYDLGILSNEIFSMMVLMALVTTFMTRPSLNFINRLFAKKQHKLPVEVRQLSIYKILVAFANPEKGKVLLRLANSFVKKLNDNALITVLHLTPNNELSQVQIDEYESESFRPVIDEAKILN